MRGNDFFNKFSTLIIYLNFEAIMTTHKLKKKRSYRQSYLFSDWIGRRPFRKIIIGGSYPPQGKSKDLNQLVCLRAVRLELYATHFSH